jgi:DNA-binding MarR family transcriptional regulator
MSALTSPVSKINRREELPSALRISVMRLARRLRNEREDAALTLSQIAVLATLERHGPLTPRELAGHEKIQPPSMTRIVAALAEQELVRRRNHPSDGRQILIELTDSATIMLQANRRRRDAWLARRIAELPTAERETLRSATTILDRLARS